MKKLLCLFLVPEITFGLLLNATIAALCVSAGEYLAAAGFLGSFSLIVAWAYSVAEDIR